jgi:hypothetical protein
MFRSATFKRAQREWGDWKSPANRFDLLQAAGFPTLLAHAVARDTRYELHALVDLAAQGCPAELAVRIVAPLDEDFEPGG